jgi:hypothetical protein
MFSKSFDGRYERRANGASGVPRKPKKDYATGVTRRRVDQLAEVFVLRDEDATLARSQIHDLTILGFRRQLRNRLDLVPSTA